MSDFRMREVRALLNTTMESVLRRAMFEIMKIMENSLHDHQLELAQKGEEIVHLKVKLQKAELQLRDALYTDGQEARVHHQMIEIQRDPEVVTHAASNVTFPEIDFEVPDDWCAPVGYESPTKQDDVTCPSEAPQVIDPNLETKGLRRSKRGILSIHAGNQTKDESLTMHDQGVRRKQFRKGLAMLLQENAAKGVIMSPRRREKDSTGKDTPQKREDRKSAETSGESAAQQTVKRESERTCTCRYCEKAFDTPFGRHVHERCHEWCKGCKKLFSPPSSLESHKSHCKKLKILLAKDAQSQDTSECQSHDAESQSHDAESQTTSSNEVEAVKKDNDANHAESVIPNDRPAKRYFCRFCGKKFRSSTRHEEHTRVHTGEKPCSCSFCPKKFRVNRALELHMMRIHKDQVNSRATNGDLAWTEPLEGNEESVSPGEETSAPVNQVVLARKTPCRLTGRGLGWQECGTQCPGGFICNVCSKFKKKISHLMEHYCVHIKQKPLKCKKCHALFRFSGKLAIHVKKCTRIHCEKCGRTFAEQNMYDKHMSKTHRDWPLSCHVCGKGFQMAGRLKNHVERCLALSSLTAK
ncbi:zinc finger protein 235-like isoform X2 [Notolabrus celidotus]|uniref:zinc finger protein 235-like isoform X2 n=1 Tax=Notolabrus celidotus TaxID=1203425 RepID=UPI00148F7E56|nr:zinc finger protein 235-like isoform X2 [Notolabrus celidotus]